MSATLEQRIATALSADTASDVVAILIAEVETAIIAADKAAAMEREKALDPLASPDAAKARAAMEDSAFTRDRLRNVLPRLQARLTELQAADYAARWQADIDQVEGRCNQLAQEYAATYPRLAAQFVDLFSRAEAVDREVSRINGSAPSGEHRRLRQVELVARGLKGFTRGEPSITNELSLPDWDQPTKLVWPPPQVPLAVQVAASMIQRPHPGANWASEREERTAALRAEQERVAAYYEAQARRREERENAEAASAAAARRSRA